MKNKKHKIVLYNPKSVFFDMPLALLAIGSYLDPNKFDVIIIDGRLEENPIKEVLEKIKGALCFGVSVITGAPISDALEVSENVKEKFSDIPVIWGGWHTSLFPKKTLEDEKSIDVTVQGQGELTFSEIIESIINKTSYENIQGITFRNSNDEIIQNSPRLIQDIDNFPDINYELINVEKYFKLKGRRQFDYISSTGCNFRCSFCSDPFVYKRKWHGNSPEKIVRELEKWYKKYNFEDVNFQDETFFTNTKRVLKMASLIIEKGINISWAGTMRADQNHRINDIQFEIIIKSGLRRVLIGVESGSQEMMDWLKKDIKIEYVLEAAQRCKKYDISVTFPFIVGFPNETKLSVKKSLDFAYQLSSMKKDFYTPVFYFKPYPGSKITFDVEKSGYELPKTTKEWASFDYIGSSGPWVNKEKFQLIENFKFYNNLATNSKHILLKPFRKIAKFRFKKNNFRFPFEKYLIQAIRKEQKLS